MATLGDKLRNRSTQLQEEEREKERQAAESQRVYLEKKMTEAPETAKEHVDKWMKEIEESPRALKMCEFEGHFSTYGSSEVLHKTITAAVEKLLKKNKLTLLESKQSYYAYEPSRGEDWGMDEHYSQTIKFKW
jgi:hypothetical protein